MLKGIKRYFSKVCISKSSLETVKFDLNNIKGNFYVESVYDGDTITLGVPMSFTTHNYKIDNKDILVELNKITSPTINASVRVRLHGIDTPELKPLKSMLNRDKHIQEAIKARDYLSSLILNKIIYVEFMDNDKYGRPLAKIYQNNICINDDMITKGYAKPYDGGKKL